MGDAGAADYAEGTVFLLYNPFGPQTMLRVLARLRASVGADPRPVRLFYANPLHRHVIEECGWLRCTRTFRVPHQVTGAMDVAVFTNTAFTAGAG